MLKEIKKFSNFDYSYLVTIFLITIQFTEMKGLKNETKYSTAGIFFN